MATLEELAKSYATKLKSSADKERAAKEIVESIDGLTYTKTKQPISKADKKQILELMIANIRSDVLLEKADNQAYLALISYMLQQLEGK
jgi:hypothetical protein